MATSTAAPETDQESPVEAEMTATDEQPESPEERPLEDLSLLEDKTPDWFKTTYRVPLTVFGLGLVFLFFSYAKLYHTDVWGHVAYGRWIVEHGQLPETEPLLPLAAGMPFVDTAWLSKVAGFEIVETLGYAGLQFVNGVGVTLTIGLLFGWIAHRTGSLGWGLFAAVLFGMVGWEHLSVFRPQLVGTVLFIALLLLLHARPRFWHRIAVPLGFVLWVNLHGSFLIGLALLGAFVVGRAVDVLVRTGSPKRLLRDRRLTRDFVLLELAGLATLMNPWGLGMHLEALSFASHPNLAAIVEWEPLSIHMLQTQLALWVLAIVFLVHRFSPRRPMTAELILLLGLGAASMWTSRFILWWGIVAAWSAGLHAAAIWNARRHTLPTWKPAEPGGKWTVVAIGWVWIVFAISPLGFQTIHGAKLDPGRQLGRRTPMEIADFLNEHPPKGLVYTTLEWGDYLLWAGPRDLKVFANSHAPVVPPEVWQDFLRISHGAYGWDELLERYGVNAVILAHDDRPELESLLRSDKAHWAAMPFPNGTIFRRREPILNGLAPQPAPEQHDDQPHEAGEAVH